MSRRLTSYVHVHLPEGGTVVYGPDDEVPADHAALIGNPKAWVGGRAPEPDRAPAPPNLQADEDVAPAGLGNTAPDNATTGEPPTSLAVPVPPRSGPGSGATAWAEYAATQGVNVEDGAGRADIIAALTAQGVPVE